MPINNKWIKRKKSNRNKTLITIVLLIIVLSYGLFEVLKYFEKKENTIITDNKDKDLQLYNTDIKNENNNIKLESENKKKSFKIKYEIVNGAGDTNFYYNIRMIINNLEDIKSNFKDNNYQIEIIGYISKYGNLFYNINKRKANNIYDNDFINKMNELKKYTFKYQDETVNFKIYIHNNSMNLN